MEVVLPVCKCLKCGYEWTPRVPDPIRCPGCLAYRWWKEPPKPKEKQAAGG